MQMIALDRVVHDTKTVPDTGLGQRCTESTHEPRLTQGRHAASQTNCHMNRNTCGDALAWSVHHPWSDATRATGAEAGSTATRVITRSIERELFEGSRSFC